MVVAAASSFLPAWLACLGLGHVLAGRAVATFAGDAQFALAVFLGLPVPAAASL
jgi:hypothetical protein